MDYSQSLVGGWRLARWTISDGDAVRHPFGENPTGALLYTPDGRMSAIVSAGDRAPLSAQPPRRAGTDELAAAFLSFFCYSGRWHVEDDWVVHTIEVALNPAMVATTQRRRIELGPDGTELDLVADEDLGHRVRTHRIGWRR